MSEPGSRTPSRLRRSAVPEEIGSDDSVLLRRFLNDRDEAAFSDLVRRHGSLVLGVGRSMLGSRQDAEDVFQATFLVLARKADSVRNQASLAGWLHGVARRLALKVRGRTLFRERREKQVAPGTARDTVIDDMTWRELRSVLHEEVSRLPEKLRLAVLLCYWQGLAQDDAARQLGCPKGTLKDRLERARDLLRSRLVRRGLVSALPVLAIWVAGSVAAEAASPTLIATTAHAALHFAAGRLPETLSPRVSQLVHGALSAMFLSKIKVASAVVLLVVLTVAGGVTARHALTADPPHARQAESPKPPREVAEEPLPEGTVRRLGSLRFRQGRRIVGLSLSADAKLMATGSSDDSVNLWDVSTGKMLRLIRDDRERDLVQNVALSPDGKLIAAGYQRGRLSLFDAESGAEVRRLEGLKQHVTGILFAPDGKTLFAGELDNPAIRCWDVATGQDVRSFPGHERGTRALSLSLDGKVLASCGYDFFTAVWDVESGKELRRWRDEAKERTYAVAVSPDGQRVATASDLKIARLWDVATGKELRKFEGHADWVEGVAFSPDGKRLVTGGRDRVAIAWDVATGEKVYELKEPRNTPRSVTFTRDGKTLAVASGPAVLLYEAATGKLLTPVEGHLGEVYSLARTPDGKVLATAGQDGCVILWDVATGKELRRLHGHPGSDVYAVAFSPDGKFIASGANDGKVVLWTATGERLATYEGHKSCVGFANFSPDGKRLVTVDWFDAGLIVWDLFDDAGKVRAKGSQVQAFKLHGNRASYVAFSPDGKTLVAADEEQQRFGGISRVPTTLRLWDLETGKELGKLEGHVGSQVRGIAFSPDGKRIASGGTYFNDDVVRIWDVATLKQIAELPSRAEAVAFSPDGRTLAVVPNYDSKEVVLWELATRGERGRLLGHRDTVMRVDWLDGGRRLATVSRDTTVLIWSMSGRPGALEDGEVASAWRDFASGDAAKSYRAMHALATVPEKAVAEIKEQLKPLAADRLKRLIADLDADEFAVREAAVKELERRLLTVEPALRKAGEEHPSVEVRSRLGRLIEQVPARASRLVELLRVLGTTEARSIIDELAKGAPELAVTKEASGSIR